MNIFKIYYKIIKSFKKFSLFRKWIIALIVAIIIASILIIIPFLNKPYITILSMSILIYIVLSVSWTTFCAPSNYYSLGVGAFFGVGIYTYAIFIHLLPSLPLPILFIISGFASSILAFFVGLTTLRIRGMYFAILTFGLGELLRHFVMWWEVNKTGTVGRWIPNVDNIIIYRYITVLAVITIITAFLFRRSRFGLALQAIGDSEVVAKHIGVKVSIVKTIVFTVSCFFIGVAGAMISTRWSYIDADFAFDSVRGMFTIMVSLFGGMDMLIGPIFGAISIGIINDVVLAKFPEISRLLLGILLVIVIIFMPKGIVGILSSKITSSGIFSRVRKNEKERL